MPSINPIPDFKAPIDRDEALRIVKSFERHINRGQVRYLKAGHLDVLETERIGVTFVDPISKRRMIDCFSSAGSFNVSRHNPQIMQVLVDALDEWDMGSAACLSEAKLAFARKLVDHAPGDLNRIRFAAGGGDAVDGAIKLAKGATKRTEVVSTVMAYHGHTGFALSANGKEHYRHYCEPLMPGFRFVPFNDLEAMRHAISDRTAAVIVEPVQGEAGIFVGTTDYLHGLRQLCDEMGAQLIFDEIQTGFGRTGRLFACEHAGVVPDIMTVAKSLGGGLYPNAAILYRETDTLVRFVDTYPDFHPSAVGGSDLGCKVSLAVLEYLIENRMWENAARQGERLKAALNNIRRRNPKIVKDVRGIGLMIGIDYLHEFMGPMMADALARHGVFAAYSGNAPQVMRFMAPITIDDAEMDRLIDAIEAAVADMKKLLPLALPAARVPVVLKMLNSEKVQTSLFGLLRKVEDGAKRIGLGTGRGAK